MFRLILAVLLLPPEYIDCTPKDGQDGWKRGDEY